MSDKISVNELLRKAQQQQAAVIQTLLEGLMTDGSHHKQWYLQQALEQIVGREQLTLMWHTGNKWREGIAP